MRGRGAHRAEGDVREAGRVTKRGVEAAATLERAA
jgi:hypothetical protein